MLSNPQGTLTDMARVLAVMAPKASTAPGAPASISVAARVGTFMRMVGHLASLFAGLCKTIIDANVSVLHPTKLFQPLSKRGETRLNHRVLLGWA